MKRNHRMMAGFASILLVLALLAGCSQGSTGSVTTTAPADSSTAAPATTSDAQAVIDSTDPIEFICCFDPGGGHDTMLRSMEKAIRANNLLENPIIYTYKPGGNQAVGMAYTNQQKGRKDCIMSTTISLVTVEHQTDIGMSYRNLTPICMWGTTAQFLFVKGDRAWKSLDDMLKSGERLTFTSSGVGSDEEITTARLKEFSGADIQSIPTGSDAESLTQVLGGHIDVLVSELGGLEDYVKSGELKILACTGEDRSVYMPDIPTLRELGYDHNNCGFRGIMGPPDMPADAVAYYVDLFKKVFDTKEFKDYMTANGVEPKFLSGDEFKAYLDDTETKMLENFKLVGIQIIQ